MTDEEITEKRRELLKEMEAAQRPGITEEERAAAVERELELFLKNERLRKYPSGLCRCDCTREAVRLAAEICESEACNAPSAADALEVVAGRIRALVVGPIN